MKGSDIPVLKKTGWFLLIFVAVVAATSVLLAVLEPGGTNAGELGRVVGRKFFLMLIVTTALYFIAKRLGWILRDRTRAN